MNEALKTVLIILFSIVIGFILVTFITVLKLWRYKQCYDNNFELPYCVKYEEY